MESRRLSAVGDWADLEEGVLGSAACASLQTHTFRGFGPS